MLPSYFDYIFVHQRQKVLLKPELSPKSLSTLGPNPTQKTRPDLQLWTGVSEKKTQKVIAFFAKITQF